VPRAASRAASAGSVSRIILVRHGRSAHAESRWIDADGLRQWMASYDAAGLAPREAPPAALVTLARDAGLVVASDLPRARASAELLVPAGGVVTTPLLREAGLEHPGDPIPSLRGMRLPLSGWAVVLGLRWARAALRGVPPPGIDQATLDRAEEAAAWLEERSAERRTVMAVTHSNFRGLLGVALARRGWHSAQRRPIALWSAWTFENDGGP
jgi:broad specificity phosphatase PhoE